MKSCMPHTAGMQVRPERGAGQSRVQGLGLSIGQPPRNPFRRLNPSLRDWMEIGVQINQELGCGHHAKRRILALLEWFCGMVVFQVAGVMAGSERAGSNANIVHRTTTPLRNYFYKLYYVSHNAINRLCSKNSSRHFGYLKLKSVAHPLCAKG